MDQCFRHFACGYKHDILHLLKKPLVNLGIACTRARTYQHLPLPLACFRLVITNGVCNGNRERTDTSVWTQAHIDTISGALAALFPDKLCDRLAELYEIFAVCHRPARPPARRLAVSRIKKQQIDVRSII